MNTVKEIAAHFKVTERTIYNWIGKGEKKDMPCKKLGSKWYGEIKEVEKWLEEK